MARMGFKLVTFGLESNFKSDTQLTALLGPALLFSMEGWVTVLHPFQQYFSHIRMMEGWTWRALCNETPFRFAKNLASSKIRTWDTVIHSWNLLRFSDCYSENYRNDLKFSDRQFWANSVDPDQSAPRQSDQGLHCLPFCLHLLNALLYGRATLFEF